jgi:hypothetical protein
MKEKTLSPTPLGSHDITWQQVVALRGRREATILPVAKMWRPVGLIVSGFVREGSREERGWRHILSEPAPWVAVDGDVL